MLLEREYKYYIAKNANNNYYNDLLTKDILEKITNDKENIEYKLMTEKPMKTELTNKDIHFIYFSDFSSTYCIFLLQHFETYYLVKAANNKYIITISDNFIKLFKSISRADLKLLGLNNLKKIIKKGDFDSNITYPFDLIYKDVGDLVNKLITTIIQDKKNNKNIDYLILNDILVLSDEHFTQMPVLSHIKKLSLLNNLNIKNLAQLFKCFPNLEELALWSISNVRNEDFLFESNLTTIELHNCQVNLEIFNFLQGDKLTKLVFDGNSFKCQKNKYTSLLTGDEWKGIRVPNLNTLLINCYDLSIDTIANFVDHFPKLHTFVISENVLKDVMKNTKTGYEKEEVTFYSFQNKETFYKLNRDIKFLNLNVESALYSESFLNLMKQRGITLVENKTEKNPIISQMAEAGGF